jgi:hypothetical protein
MVGRNERGGVTLEALLCILCFFAFTLAAGATLWQGFRARVEEHRHFTLQREKLRFSPPIPAATPPARLRGGSRQP